jgi:electron transport complex protein RnfD
MLDVLIALLPTTAASIWLYGERVVWILLVAMAAAVAVEALWQRLSGKPIQVGDLSALVTGLMLGLNLSPVAPLWMTAIGSAFAILIVKQLFGGLGHNFLNPALAARAVLLTSWPQHMTTFLMPERAIGTAAPIGEAITSATGATAVGDAVTSATVVSGAADAVTSATPLTYGHATLFDLFWGNIPGTIGEVCKIAILIGFVYLVVRKVIGPHIPILLTGTVALLTWLTGGDPLAAILSGGVLLGAVFMATDYVTNPMLIPGQCLYAIGCGVIIVVIRQAPGGYPEGVTYAILLMNALSPLIDKMMKRRVYGEVRKHA